MEKKMYETPEVEVIMLSARDAMLVNESDVIKPDDPEQPVGAPRRGHRDMWNEE